MRWPSMLAIYFLFWSFSVFLVLPFGVRTTDEAGADRIAGQAESAPHDFRAGRIAFRVTIVATVLWSLFMLNYRFDWIGASTVDLFGALQQKG